MTDTTGNAALIAQLRSNADAHHEPEGTERRRAAAALAQSDRDLAEAREENVTLRQRPWKLIPSYDTIPQDFFSPDDVVELMDARDVKIAELSATVEAVETLHRAERRYLAPGFSTWSFDSAAEAAEWLDDPIDAVTFFEICAECGRIESGQLAESGEEWGYRASLWPCRTAAVLDRAGTTERKGQDDDNDRP